MSFLWSVNSDFEQQYNIYCCIKSLFTNPLILKPKGFGGGGAGVLGATLTSIKQD